jgi:acetate CoA/acetoacetate CoA-transferase alpha subunit
MKQAIKTAAAAALVNDGAVVMIGGFMGVGSPHRLIDALVEAGRRNLTIIANDTARPGLGIGKLISKGAVSHVVTSHIGLNPDTQKAMISGKIKVDLVPQGTLIERIRSAGFGLGGVLTKTGLGTLAAEGQRTIEIDGEEWLLATPLKADFALIHADQADHLGNLTYQLTATNFNPILAMAADVVICEAREILPVGAIPPDSIKTPGILVDYLIERPRP